MPITDATRYQFIRWNGGCPLTGWPEASNDAERDAAVDAAIAKSAFEPQEAMTPPETLASRMIDAWCDAHGKPCPWHTAVHIVAEITKLPHSERCRLLVLGTTGPESCQHLSTMAFTNYTYCNDCCSIKADSSWGVASRKWFKSLDDAMFYMLHGRLPE